MDGLNQSEIFLFLFMLDYVISFVLISNMSKFSSDLVLKIDFRGFNFFHANHSNSSYSKDISKN